MATGRLAHASARHPWGTIVIWVFILAAAALSAKASLAAEPLRQGAPGTPARPPALPVGARVP
jgi:hypothetical protein